MLRNKVRLGPSPKSPLLAQQAEARHLDQLTETQDERARPSQIGFDPLTRPNTADERFKPQDLLFLHLLVTKLEIPVFDLPEKFGLQGAAPRWNRHETQGAPYILGAGASCIVVQHETDDDTSEVVPKGTIVALKRYKYNDTADLAADKDLANVIWQDLRVLCHPQLRNHENFCRILYLAWESFSVVPALALELAAFGSLQDALESEFQLSWLQKCHISMDITAGLHTLHGCGLVHGDIKPTNIMLQRHDERQIVAKILDFSGVTDAERFGTASHRRFMSKLWLPPEVLFGAKDLRWQLADLYSYGMLLTHMWCDIDFEVYESYLETSIPRYFNASQKNDMMLYFKSCPEDDAQSVLSQSLTLAKKHSKDSRSRDIMIPLEYIQRGTLLVDPSGRVNLDQILQQFRHFAAANGRDIPKTMDTKKTLREENKLWDDANQVFSEKFTDRTHEHKRTILEYMIKVAGPPVLSSSKLVRGTDADYLDAIRLLGLINRNMEVEQNIAPHEEHWRRAHYQISMCYLMGHGTNVDESRALQFLASAAFGFIRRAMFMYTSVEASIEVEIDIDIPHQLFLCYAYVFDCTESGEVLQTQFPRTFEILRNIRHKLGIPLSMTICSGDQDTEATSDDEPSVSEPQIFDIIDKEDTGGLQLALQSDHAAKQQNQYGLTTLHALSLISDDIAAAMAPLLLGTGAELSKEVTEVGESWKNLMGLGWGTPVVWSVVKRKQKLFAAFLDWCAENDMEPPVGNATLFLLTVIHRQNEMLRKLLSYRLIFKEEGKDIASPHSQVKALRRIIELNDGYTVLRRWTLGSHFRSARAAVAETIVQLGADLFAGQGVHGNPIRKAILNGDGVCLVVFTRALERQGHTLNEILGRDGILKNGHSRPVNWSALHGSVSARSMEAFLMLLTRLPQFIEQASAIGETPLHYAVGEGNADAVRHLLAHKASVEHYDGLGSTPVVKALTHNYIDIAGLLVKHCNLARVLGPNPVNRATAFGLVLQTYVSGRKRISVRSFEFLRRLGSLSFISDEDSRDPVWRMILMKDRPVLQEHITADIRLLEYFLRKDIFGDKIDDIDWTGRAAIHYAARYGYIEALKLFIEHGASINIESGPCSRDEEFGSSPGLTAVDWALLMRDKGAPRRIRAGGAGEIKSWQTRISSVLKYLVEHGGDSGSGADHSLEVMKIKDPDGSRGISIHPFNPSKGDETWRGRWPERIPECPTKSPTTERLPVLWRDQGSDDEPTDREEARTQTIVYRTSSGKKHRLNDIILSDIGSMIDTPSPEDDEDVKQEMDGRLKYAQAFINSKIAKASQRSAA